MRSICRTPAFLSAGTTALVICGVLASCGVLPSFNAAITLEGTVEDEEGRALEGVRLYARETRFDLSSESFTSKDESVFELSDGRFHFDCSRCSGVTLDFSKDGYYSETVSFHVEKEERSAGRFSGEEAQNLVRSDLQIALRSDRNKATLVSYEARLRSAPDGPVTVAALRRDLGSNGVRLERLGEPPSRSAQYLPGYVRLLAAVDAEGALATEPLPDVPGHRARVPAPAVLDFSEADGGVVLHQFASGNQREIYRSMRTAPAEGYEPSLVIGTGDRSGEIYYFFFRSGDRYGKGLVVPPSFGHARDGREVVTVHLELRLNPDGSRNVETAN